MKKINQLNQYLLEKYPTIWNTKIVWILLSATVIHILFFIIGYASHSNPESLQKTSAVNDYFTNGMIYIHLIISVLMLVAWLIAMFKNNAFKNFYPMSSRKLFFQFVQYFIIIFVSITFYFSYMFGFKLFISQRYNDEKMTKNIELINKIYPFLSQNSADYTLDNRLYPRPFFDLYCERDIKKIDRDKKYFVYYDQVYQYFSVYSKTSYKQDKDGEFIIPEPEKSNGTQIAYSNNNGKSTVYYFKKEVVDVSPYIKTTALSYYNYSTIFYDSQDEQVYAAQDEYDLLNNNLRKRQEALNKSITTLLERKNPAELEKMFGDFLQISNEFGIKNNLDPKTWTKMVYNPDNFEVRYFTKKYLPRHNDKYDPNYTGDDYNGDYAATVVDSAAAAISEIDENGNVVNADISIQDFNPKINEQLSPEDYFKKNLTDYYYFSDPLKNLLINVDVIKSKDYITETIHFYFWIAFAIALLIFSFRATGLKPVLFGIISAGVLALVIALIGFSSRLFFYESDEFFISYLTLIIALMVLSIPVFMMKRVGKFIASIFITISVNGFPLLILLIFGIISIHQNKNCSKMMADNEDYTICHDIFDTLGLVNVSWIILIISFAFIYFYTSVLQKWKALPE